MGIEAVRPKPLGTVLTHFALGAMAQLMRIPLYLLLYSSL
jgi:hypothetical protein